MTLNKWMADNDIRLRTLAKHLNCSIFAIRKWLRGERIPRPQMQAEIARVTGNAVQGNDWVEVARRFAVNQEKAAEWLHR